VPTSRGTIVTASFFEHDVLPLSNGHVILLVRHEVTVDIVTVIGSPPAPMLVIGNALIDLDESFQPVWVWSTFDYLDINRRPMLFPDWTHCNAIVATPDGHLLLSSRHQSWIMKLDYANGAGSGRLLWTLGFGGTFALTGGDPGDWFYGQHAPAIVATDDARITRLAVVDDGNGRLSLIQSDVAQDKSVPPPGPATPASFSRGVIYELDETLRTARLSWKYEPGFFTWWGGSILVLPNGNVELDLPQPFALPNTSSRVLEVTSDQPNPKIVWQMDVSPGNAYRSTRIPSLYPGVQW